MNGIIIGILIIGIISFGFFLGLNNSNNLSFLKDDTPGLPDGGVVNTGTVSVNEDKLTDDELYTLSYKYIISGETDEKLSLDGAGSELIRKINKIKESYPISKDLQEFFSITVNERKSFLEEKYLSLDKESMAYSSISDVIKDTKLCSSFSDKDQCIEQYQIIKDAANGKPTQLERLTFDSPKLVGVYAHENSLSEDQFKELIVDLLKKEFKK